jgi:signal transduction histidine kinase
MPVGQTIRVRVAAPLVEARRLCTRLTRGGIPAALDDGTTRTEVLVVGHPDGDLAPYRARAEWLVVLGAPGAAYFAAGADDVVLPAEPELLFRRLRAALERLDLFGRVDRLNQRVLALEAGLADAAHDVRSPLQAVIGNAELLARDTSLTSTQRDCAAACVRQGIRAMQLAERILEAAKQRSRAALDVEAVDLGELIDGAVAQASPVAKQRGVTISAVPPSRPVEIRADGELLARVLDNLIGNAIRFSPRGSQIEVAGWRASPRFVRLSVKDQGEGIPQPELPKLVAGLGPGRGLRIARDIAERHGGELGGRRDPVLPRDPAAAAGLAAQRPARLRRFALAEGGLAHAEDRVRRAHRHGERRATGEQAHRPGAARSFAQARQEARCVAHPGQGGPGPGDRATEPDGGCQARPHARAPGRLIRVILP